jgi:Zn-dependent protease with chaperone function
VLLVVADILIGTKTWPSRWPPRFLFVGPDDWHFGKRQASSDCPRLFATVAEVAGQVGAGPPDEIWISYGNEFYLSQARRGPLGLFVTGRRVLVIGLGVMGLLNMSELKALVAHECARSGRAVSFLRRFLLEGAFTLREATRRLARSGRLNPFYWVLFAYNKLYGMLAAVYIRSCVYRADHVASTHYGVDVFLSGLRKLCTDGALCEQMVRSNITKQLKEKKAFINVYKGFRDYLRMRTDQERRHYDDRLLNESRSRFDDHPTFGERAAALADLPSAPDNDRTPAMGMFDYPEEKEKELTDWLTEIVNLIISA